MFSGDIERDHVCVSGSKKCYFFEKFCEHTRWMIPYVSEDTKYLTFMPGDYELRTFTVSRNNEEVSINYLVINCLNFVLLLN